ncbi:aprataxin and PNK-like factor [Anthonomus grandis grandis]|uniref:aprataxin and PNK-like factor n=1 Tax=Anthonomus grandis grandis TaxID=2921223 RepID=UPI002166576C|nr:aprataxin and PNK-like factor [Anthonomus grandis grandis]
MTKLLIYRLDDTAEKDCIVSLSQGEHIIGRGSLLQINDKRVSRKHALIQVTGQNITLTSTHENPCFFKADKGKALTIIRKDQKNPIEDGDQFALLPDDLWFRVRVENEKNENAFYGKRLLEDVVSSDINSKKTKLMETEIQQTDHTSPQEDDWNFQISEFEADTASTSLKEVKTSRSTEEVTLNTEEEPMKVIESPPPVIVNNEAEQVKEDKPATEIKQEPEEVIEERTMEIKEEPQSQETPVVVEVKVEPADVLNRDDTPLQNVNAEENATSSAENPAQTDNTDGPKPKIYRDRCWYGDRCFRRNPNHRQQFAHPGDPDYQSDPEDDRPMCPYGASCYRVNPEHRRDYKHLGKPAPKPPAGQPVPPGPIPPKKKDTPKKKRATKKPKKQQSFDGEDDYDYDDPFLNDDSSDDFEPTDSESDLDDSHDSNACTEESQDQRRMLKEAKKFLKADKTDEDD